VSIEPAPLRLVIVGAGPTAASFLERLVASVPELLPARSLAVHLVDPHPAGTGRIWRGTQSKLLWMNSMAEDVTMFTDASVSCTGPIVPGPSLYEWSRTYDGPFADAELEHEIRSLDPMTFPTRRVQSAYLDWYLAGIVDRLPANVSLDVHQREAVDLTEDESGLQLVHLDDGQVLEADTVVLSLGHLERELDDREAAHARFAAGHGLFHLGPAHTVDADLSGIQPGSNVVVQGIGLAFIDLVVLLTEGRGGRYHEDSDGRLRYQPSGREPIVHVGSRRGVPYRAKLGYRLQGRRAPLPRFFGNREIDDLLASGRHLEFFPDVWPLMAKEITWAYYHELFTAHPERTTVTWDEFDRRYAPMDFGTDELDALVAATVPDPEDRFDIGRLDRPLDGVRFDSADALQAHVRAHVAADLARRADPEFSADLGAFYALLVVFGQLGRVVASGRLGARSKVEDADGWWFGFFSYFASGPPAPRLRQLQALAEAGLLRYLGASSWVEPDPARGRFRAGGANHDETVLAEALVEARIAPPSVSRSTSRLLRNLYARGAAREEVLVDPDSGPVNTGRLLVSGDDLRLIDAGGTPHDHRHALGIHTSRPAAGAFSRPRTNAPAFRQNDTVARSVLLRLARVTPTAALSPS